MALGEVDILKMVQALPGVKTVGEASSGFNVRGGATDQNLILLNDGTIYNPNHLFGFFAAFNSDMVKEAEIYKRSIPHNMVDVFHPFWISPVKKPIKKNSPVRPVSVW